MRKPDPLGNEQWWSLYGQPRRFLQMIASMYVRKLWFEMTTIASGPALWSLRNYLHYYRRSWSRWTSWLFSRSFLPFCCGLDGLVFLLFDKWNVRLGRTCLTGETDQFNFNTFLLDGQLQLFLSTKMQELNHFSVWSRWLSELKRYRDWDG